MDTRWSFNRNIVECKGRKAGSMVIWLIQRLHQYFSELRKLPVGYLLITSLCICK